MCSTGWECDATRVDRSCRMRFLNTRCALSPGCISCSGLKHVRGNSPSLLTLINYAALLSDNAHCVGTASRRELMTTFLRHNERVGADLEIRTSRGGERYCNSADCHHYVSVFTINPCNRKTAPAKPSVVVSLDSSFSFYLLHFILSLLFIMSSARCKLLRK